MSFLLFLICLARIPGSAPLDLPAPVNVSVVSINFAPTLQWDPGPGTPAGTLYRVSKRTNNKKFKLLDRLTNATSMVLKLNASNMFQFRVWATFNGSESKKTEVEFDPYTDNVVGPLNLSLSGCGSCLRVNISLPEADRHSGVPDIQKLYDSSFKVFWRKGSQGKVEELSTKNKSFTLSNLEKGVEYCVQADMSGQNPKKTIPSAWSCAFTSPAEPRTGAAAVVTSLILLFILSMMVLSGLFYTGFLCELKATRPRALMTPPAKVPIFTPDETLLDPVSITPAGMTKQIQLLGASLTSSEDEEEEAVVPLYIDRIPELSSRESSGLESRGGSGEGQEAAENVFKSLNAPAEEEEVHEGDEDGTEADEEEGGITENSSQTGVQGEEERIPEISSNVNLVSVMLASLAAGDEDEEEEHKDFLKHLRQAGSRTPSEDEVCELLLQPADEVEDSRALGAMQSEEEEEEEFSEYLRHGRQTVCPSSVQVFFS
ncbi:interleukin-20 receptor subunit alpha [Oryzias melastigma]|uniref:Interleukin-20 receptor subunit alpha-like n=1 Tax=Oryzias melastigma TaxID=30732 RepID=A0A3B3DQJ6_ORYME|nr:interleukin-20 receptor subunit alpha [Oryzias melastigma]